MVTCLKLDCLFINKYYCEKTNYFKTTGNGVHAVATQMYRVESYGFGILIFFSYAFLSTSLAYFYFPRTMVVFLDLTTLYLSNNLLDKS